MTTAPGAAATVGLPVTQIPAGNAMKSDNMRDPGTIGAEDADAGPALAEGLDPSTVLMAMSRDMQHEGTVVSVLCTGPPNV